jgi:hypothetical protein
MREGLVAWCDGMSAEQLRFNVYGWFFIELRREGDAWIAYRLDGEGKRRRDNNTVVPPDRQGCATSGRIARHKRSESMYWRE